MQVKHGKFNFVLGVSWHNAQDKGDLKALQTEFVGKSRVSMDMGTSTWIGFAPGRTTGIAAALAISRVFSDLILAERVSEEQYWLCVIHQGMPVQGRDILVDINEMQSTILEWTSFFPSAAVYGDIQGSHGPVNEIWTRLLEAIANNEVSKKTLNSFQLKSVLTTREMAIVAVVFLSMAAVIAGAWFVFQPKTLTAEELASQQSSFIDTEAKRKAEKERLEAIAAKVKIHKAQVLATQARIEKARVESALPGWFALYSRMPQSLRGYRPSNMSCAELLCKLEWRGSNKLRSEDRFSLASSTDAVGAFAALPAAVAASAPASSASAPPAVPSTPLPVINLVNNLGDYGLVLDYQTKPVLRTLSQSEVIAITPSEKAFELFRARVVDLLNELVRGPIPFQLGAPRPLVVPGVPEGNVPDVTVAYVADLSLTLNGVRAGSNLQFIDRELASRLAAQGVVLTWNEMALTGGGQDTVNAKASLYLVPPDFK